MASECATPSRRSIGGLLDRHTRPARPSPTGPTFFPTYVYLGLRHVALMFGPVIWLVRSSSFKTPAGLLEFPHQPSCHLARFRSRMLRATMKPLAAL